MGNPASSYRRETSFSHAFLERASGDPISKGEGTFARMDDPQCVELEVREGRSHGSGQLGDIAAFELNPDLFAMVEEQEIEFAPAVDRVEICLVRLVGSEDFFHRKTFPRGTEFWMGEEIGSPLARSKNACEKEVPPR